MIQPSFKGNPSICLDGCGTSWPLFWQVVCRQLRARGYSRSTLKVYRHVFRSFSKWCHSSPDRVTRKTVETYVWQLTSQHCSWSWISTSISVLRTAFDKLSGRPVSTTVRTPRRPRSLPSFLNRTEMWHLLSAAATPRDQLLLGLMYGCGLKVGEVCSLQWGDIDSESGTIHIREPRGDSIREIAYPTNLAELLQRGISECQPSDYLFPGNRRTSHLSTRMAEYVVRQAARDSGVNKPVCAMTLRHSYAVHRLSDGASLREIQYALGHRNIHSTTPYLLCRLPAGARSPLDQAVFQYVPANVESTGQPMPVPAPDLPPALPFPPVHIGVRERAEYFYRSIKTHFRGRYLAVRRARAST